MKTLEKIQNIVAVAEEIGCENDIVLSKIGCENELRKKFAMGVNFYEILENNIILDSVKKSLEYKMWKIA